MQALIQSSPVQSLLQSLDSLVAKLPTNLQNVIYSPLVQRGLVTLIALRLLIAANKQLSWYSLNNFTKQKRWDPENELVLVTGGSSGIGHRIVKDLAKLKIKVVVLDIQESKSSWRTYPARSLPPVAGFADILV